VCCLSVQIQRWVFLKPYSFMLRCPRSNWFLKQNYTSFSLHFLLDAEAQTYIRGVFEKKRDCEYCMNMLYSSDKSLVVLRSTIIGICTNESSALSNNRTVFAGFPVVALQLSSFWDYCKKLWFLLVFCLVVKRCFLLNESTWSFLFD